jgi:hypothetical protein
LPKCFANTISILTTVCIETVAIAESRNGTIYPFNTESVSRTSVAISKDPYTSNAKSNLFGTSGMALQSSADRSILFASQKFAGHVCIVDTPNERLSFAFA